MDRAKKEKKQSHKTSLEQLKKSKQRHIPHNEQQNRTLPGSRIENNPDFDAILQAIKNEESR